MRRTSWQLPDGWTVQAETQEIEVTRDGTLPPYEVDIVRRFIPGETTAWLTSPDGEEIPLPVPFTLADIEQAIARGQ